MPGQFNPKLRQRHRHTGVESCAAASAAKRSRAPRVNRAGSLALAAVANNPGRQAAPIYPAAYAGVWAITAVDAAGKLYSQASRVRHITLAAPEAELWVSANGGVYVSGTYVTASASAPPT